MGHVPSSPSHPGAKRRRRRKGNRRPPERRSSKVKQPKDCHIGDQKNTFDAAWPASLYFSPLRAMDLRNHPLMSRRGARNWPPVWTWIGGGENKRPKGEVG